MFNATGADLYDETERYEPYNACNLTAYSDSDGPDQMGDHIRLKRIYHEYYSISHADSPCLAITGSIALLGKIRLTQLVGTGEVYGIISKWNSSGNRQYAITINQDNKLAFMLSSNGTSISSTLYSDTVLSADTWYTFVCIYNGSTVRIFINGVLDKQDNYSSGIYDGSANFEIGRYDESNTNCSNIDMQYMGVFDRELTS